MFERVRGCNAISLACGAGKNPTLVPKIYIGFGVHVMGGFGC